MKGVERIAAERKRQITEERWDAAHDDRHKDGELARAAICYAASALGVEVVEVGTAARFTVGSLWPWSEDWDKRDKHDDIRSLEISGALIAAEIDRRIRVRGESSSLTVKDLKPGELFQALDDGSVHVKTTKIKGKDFVCLWLDSGEELLVHESTEVRRLKY